MIIFCVLCVILVFSDTVYGKAAEYYPGRCEISNTRYTLPERCDIYMECYNGEPSKKTCRYGQYFYNITDIREYACQYLDGNYCGDRQYYKEYVYDDSLCNQQFTQPKFRVGDATTCNEYVECSQGKLFNKKCDADTAFHPVDHICVWPGDSPDCDAPSFCAHIGKYYDSETKMCN